MNKDDLKMIKYFYEEKGDPTRYVGWDIKKLEEHYPLIAKAYREMRIATIHFETLLEVESAPE